MSGDPLNKTYEEADLLAPEVKASAAQLNRYARRLFWRGVPFAVNGVLRRRFYIRRHKMWEYARGLAYSRVAPPMRVLDFGGGATLPVFYLAEQGCDVTAVDINQPFTNYTNAVARRRHLRLSALSVNLVERPIPADFGTFDRILSFCVIEHLPKEAQQPMMKTLAGLLRPKGVMVVTFDFGPEAPSEWPIRSVKEVEELVQASGLRRLGNQDFLNANRFFVIDKRHPAARFTLGSLFLTTP
ncbi:MAG: class I SAM-dependent methyltransferase [Nitrospirota bacterium]